MTGRKPTEQKESDAPSDKAKDVQTGAPNDDELIAHDIDRDGELRWIFAVAEWFAGNKEPLAAAILDPSLPLVPDVRAFLADLISGTVERPQGRPSEYSGRVERSIAARFFAEWERLDNLPRLKGQSPRNEAFETVAAALDMRPDQIRGVIERLRKDGITVDLWRQRGRPDWTNR